MADMNTGKNSSTKKPAPNGNASKIIIIAVVAILIISGVLFVAIKGLAPNNDAAKSDAVKTVSIMTDKGEIVVELRQDLMPITVGNFMGLVNKGFYDGLTFHRVEDWVIQGGDPEGTGMGGSDKTIKLETNPEMKNVKYAVAMARSSDPDSASSQFYILKSDASWLDGGYAVFGNVVSGMDVVDKIAIGDKMTKVKEK